ncbi:GNAT family N-acetyltransferase [Paraburkholderia sp. B3]|uniref:GNAT family N-acetyltransferase n=1 Tax=Paraburkholderia sp. B3 TaxID=3134791 RepID=UPI0039822EBB
MVKRPLALHRLGYETTPALILKNAELLISSPTDKVLIVTIDGKFVGSISLHVLSLFHAAGYLERITSMVVDEHYRGDGIGRALISAAECWFKTVECVKLEATSGDCRPDAQ